VKISGSIAAVLLIVAAAGCGGPEDKAAASTPAPAPTPDPAVPAWFEEITEEARERGFLLVSATPLTRSSYHAAQDFRALKQARETALGGVRP
jgi:lipoic acid synthetase